MKTEIYSHNNGENIVNNDIKESILHIIKNLNFEIKQGCANELRQAILSKLKAKGWSDEFVLTANSRITLTSYLDNHVLCFQTGNMSRFYADMLKTQFVYNSKKAVAAIYIVPSKSAAKIMGSNIANFNRFTLELNLFKNTITIPALVISIS
jgi:hypothetical protein